MIARNDPNVEALRRYENAYPLCFPWNRAEKDVPRYFREEDGWWRDPAALPSGKALLACTGDLMCEPRMTRANQYGGTMFFHPLFQFVRNVLRSADFTVGNLETTVTAMTPYAGQYHTVAGKYHCNAPECYLDALRYAGFDAFVNANNHNCDSAVAGLIDTNRAIDRHGFMRTGSFLPGETERALLVEVCGIRIGIVSYATYFNKLDAYFTEEGRETLLNAFAPEKAVRDVAWARERGAEVVLSYIHWGKSYVHEPTDLQRQQAQALADAGVDCIVGSHSHCLQIEHTLTASDGRRVPVIYSMGNFVTNESQDLCRHCGVLQLLLEKTGDGIRLTRWFVPCLVMDEFGTGRYACVPADPLLSGGYDHPEQLRNRAFVKKILPGLPEPVSGGMTLREVCDLWGVEKPAELPDAGFVRISSQAARPVERALYFSCGGGEKFSQLQLRRHRPTAVVSEEPMEGQSCIIVPDVRGAYLSLCREIRSRHKAKLIAVAGGAWKTETKAALSRALLAGGRVLTHEDDVDIDEFCCLNLHPSHDFCVQELRSDHPMGMDIAARALAPDLCVLTACGHGLEELISAMEPGKTLLYCADDEDLCGLLERLDTRRLLVVPYHGGPVSAARICARVLGVDAGKALTDYRYDGMEHTDISCGDVRVLTDYACKSENAARASAMELLSAEGKKIAVIEARFAKLFRGADAVIVLDDLPEDREERFAALREVEDRLLAELTPGCTVLFCGDRKLELNVVLRRIFGLTDGVITDLW